MNIGENIKKYRKLRGLTQKELGELSNISTSTITKYELGQRTPKIEQIISLARVLDCGVDELSSELMGTSSETRESITIAELMQKQYELDELILTKVKNITPKELLLSRIVAMLTEVGEWANEEQSFKYWKNNKKFDREKEIEEFVDVLFFYLSIGNLCGYSPGEIEQAYKNKWEENVRRQRDGY